MRLFIRHYPQRSAWNLTSPEPPDQHESPIELLHVLAVLHEPGAQGGLQFRLIL